MRFLITGGAGFIGSALVRYLVEEGHQPTIFDTRTDTALWGTICDSVTRVKGSVESLPLLVESVKENDIQHIIHTAALFDYELHHPAEYIDTNVRGTMNVFEAARICDLPRVVYCSTGGIFKSVPLGEIPVQIDEDYPKLPRRGGTLYCISKLYSEYVAETYLQRYHTECVGMRFSTTFGPGKNLRRRDHPSLICTLIDNAINRIPTVVEKGGDQKNDYIYVKDIARALVQGCLVHSLNHHVFNIGSSAPLSLFEISDAINRVLNFSDISIGHGLDFEQRGNRGYVNFNIERARKELNFEPFYSIDRAIKDYYETYRYLNLSIREE